MRSRALAALLGVALLAFSARAQSIDVPRGTGWVNDTAQVLSDKERSALESRLAAFEKKHGHELALLTVPTTSGRPIEEYALAVGRTWKLGKPGKNDGALLVVAVQDRKLRIEVGRGLEGELTDLLCGRIIRDVMVPRFRAGDMPGGIRAGTEAMIAIAGGAGANALPQRGDDPVWTGIALFLIIVVVVVIMLVRRISGGFGGRYRGGLFPFPMMLGGGGGRGGFGGRSGGFGGFGGGGGFSGGGASGGW